MRALREFVDATKVAISQCVREAFPKEYEGMYSEDEMVASGAIPADYKEVRPTETVVMADEPTISKEQKTLMVLYLKEHFGQQEGAKILQEVCMARGINSPDKIKQSDYEAIMSDIEAKYQDLNQSINQESPSFDGESGFLEDVENTEELSFK